MPRALQQGWRWKQAPRDRVSAQFVDGQSTSIISAEQPLPPLHDVDHRRRPCVITIDEVDPAVSRHIVLRVPVTCPDEWDRQHDRRAEGHAAIAGARNGNARQATDRIHEKELRSVRMPHRLRATRARDDRPSAIAAHVPHRHLVPLSFVGHIGQQQRVAR